MRYSSACCILLSRVIHACIAKALGSISCPPTYFALQVVHTVSVRPLELPTVCPLGSSYHWGAWIQAPESPIATLHAPGTSASHWTFHQVA